MALESINTSSYTILNSLQKVGTRPNLTYKRTVCAALSYNDFLTVPWILLWSESRAFSTPLYTLASHTLVRSLHRVTV